MAIDKSYLNCEYIPENSDGKFTLGMIFSM